MALRYRGGVGGVRGTGGVIANLCQLGMKFSYLAEDALRKDDEVHNGPYGRPRNCRGCGKGSCRNSVCPQIWRSSIILASF